MTSCKNVKFTPIGDRVLVERIESQTPLKGGIILPDSAKKKQESVKVIALGQGKWDKNGNLVPPPVKVGDIVLMDKYAGQQVQIEDKEYLILRSDDIIAIVE